MKFSKGFFSFISISSLVLSQILLMSPANSQTEISQPRIISFSGFDWKVRSTKNQVGPGPNYFSDSNENVFVDNDGQLHLKITEKDNKWYCGSVEAVKSLGYGTYRFYLA